MHCQRAFKFVTCLCMVPIAHFTYLIHWSIEFAFTFFANIYLLVQISLVVITIAIVSNGGIGLYTSKTEMFFFCTTAPGNLCAVSFSYISQLLDHSCSLIYTHFLYCVNLKQPAHGKFKITSKWLTNISATHSEYTYALCMYLSNRYIVCYFKYCHI